MLAQSQVYTRCVPAASQGGIPWRDVVKASLWDRDGGVEPGRCGAGEVWSRGGVEPGRCGPGEVWSRGGVEPGRCGAGEVWSRGGVEPGRCGPGEVWSRGGVGPGRCGAGEVWSRGGVGPGIIPLKCPSLSSPTRLIHSTPGPNCFGYKRFSVLDWSCLGQLSQSRGPEGFFFFFYK